MKYLQKLKNKKGFTLIELIVVIAIIGILAAILVPRFGNFTADAKRKALETTASNIKTAIETVYSNTGSWPANGSVNIAAAGTVTIGQISVKTKGAVASYDSADGANYTFTVTDGTYTTTVDAGAGTIVTAP